MMAGTMGTVSLFIESRMPARLAEELIAHVPDVRWAVSVLALLLMVIPWGFLDDKKIRKEVRQELRERPRYWKRAMVIYIAAIVALVVAVNIAFPYL